MLADIWSGALIAWAYIRGYGIKTNHKEKGFTSCAGLKWLKIMVKWVLMNTVMNFTISCRKGIS
jgi:hypothetical protein